MMFIKKQIIKFQLPKLCKKNKLKRHTVNYENAFRIGILVTLHNHEKQHAVDSLVERLEAENKEVQVLCYDKRRSPNRIFGYLQFYNKDISLWGNFRAEYIIDFINNDFDYLLHLDMESESDVVMDKILCLSRSKCRIGYDSEAHRNFYEMMFIASSIEEMSDMILHYTKVVAIREEKA